MQNHMTMQQILDDNDVILTEAAVIESLRRSGDVDLHPRLENALLIYEESGRRALSRLYRGFIDVARMGDVPVALCTPTWRANRERISAADVTTDVNGDAVNFLKRLREECEPRAADILIGGLAGCRNDCYKPEEGLSTDDAIAFHSWQVNKLAQAGVDFLMAATLPALPEAVGMALSMAQTDIPFIISFVINRQGRLLDGSNLEHAIREIDAASGRPALGYMINCAYPSFLNPHQHPKETLSRLIGFQANASSLDHAQLDGAEALQADDLSDWGDLMIALNKKFGVKILGGCCGTTREHLEYIVENLIHRP